MASVLPRVIDESLFQCRLCCRPAADPRLLACLHVFCRTCLLRHVAKLRAAAAAQPQNAAVAQNESDDRTSPEPSEGAPAAGRGDPVVDDGFPPACVGGPPSSIALPPTRRAQKPFVVGDDDDDYEIPQDYEDVDSGQTYANDVMVGAASHLVTQTEQGYAVMASKPSSSPQVFTARRTSEAHSAVCAMARCLSVCHKPKFSRN